MAEFECQIEFNRYVAMLRDLQIESNREEALKAQGACALNCLPPDKM